MVEEVAKSEMREGEGEVQKVVIKPVCKCQSVTCDRNRSDARHCCYSWMNFLQFFVVGYPVMRLECTPLPCVTLNIHYSVCT